jgi:hypothetical protein
VASAFRSMMKADRAQLGLSVVRPSWLLGVTVRRYREIEAGRAIRASRRGIRCVSYSAGPKRSRLTGRCRAPRTYSRSIGTSEQPLGPPLRNQGTP